MADSMDEAVAASEVYAAAALRKARGEAIIAAPETGECLVCGQPLKGRRWCDAACRDEWEKDAGSGGVP